MEKTVEKKATPEIKFFRNSSPEKHEEKSAVMRAAGFEPWAYHFSANGIITIIYKRFRKEADTYSNFVE